MECVESFRYPIIDFPQKLVRERNANIIMPFRLNVANDKPSTIGKISNILQILMIVLLIIYIFLFFVVTQENIYIDFYFLDSLYFLGIILILLRVYLIEKDRIAWLFVTLGILLWIIADGIYYISISKMDPLPTTSIIDWLYISFYMCLYIAVILFVKSQLKKVTNKLWLDSAVLVFGVATYLSLFFPTIYEKTYSNNMTSFMLSMGNVLSGALLICLLVGVLNVTMWRLDPMWWFFITGSLFLWATDTIYYITNGISGYTGGDPVDLGWTIGMVLIAFASWRRSEYRLRTEYGIKMIFSPLVAMFTSFLILLYASHYYISTISIALILLTFTFGILRLIQILYQLYGLEKINNKTFYDGLTGLRNRYFINAYIELAASKTHKKKQRTSIILVKMHSIKGINDAFGVPVGDEVIKELSNRLRIVAQREGYLARFSGGKFGLLMTNETSNLGIDKIVEEIEDSLEIPIVITTSSHLSDISIQIDYSIGTASEKGGGENLYSLPQKAENALHKARTTHTTVVNYSPLIDEDDGQIFLVEQLLRSALLNGEITCYYQPKLDLVTNTSYEVEALVRWDRPGETVMPPHLFFPAAKRSGLMFLLTERVLDIALQQTKEWRDQGMPICMSVNITAKDLSNKKLVETVKTTLKKYNLPGNVLMLEITETDLIEEIEIEKVRKTTEILSQHGVSFSIDDYGTGHSSMERIKHFKIRELKLDRSFITGIGYNSSMNSFVRTTIDLAHDLGIVLVAEGVETFADLEQLRALGCDTVQGYHICKPGPSPKITQWLKENNEQNIIVQQVKNSNNNIKS